MYFAKDVQFCGSELPHDFYGVFESVQVDFVSNSDSLVGTGFKLEYSIASKFRVQGHLLVNDILSRDLF